MKAPELLSEYSGELNGLSDRGSDRGPTLKLLQKAVRQLKFPPRVRMTSHFLRPRAYI